MCGINGIIDFGSGASVHVNALRCMNNALIHRGPDDGNTYVDGPAALGHRRLSIIDLSAAGRQPMQSSNGRFILVFNGEIYNYAEIRKELDYPFRSKCDSEVLLAAWQIWGERCIERFNGMFAFAIWDRKDSILHLVRDRVGIKPLYYYKCQGKITFSSELRPILLSKAVPAKLNSASLVDYLRYQCVHQPDTIIQDVHLLPAGAHMRVAAESSRMEIYWHPVDNTIPTKMTPTQAKLAVHDALMKAVDRRLISDVPFGAFLSGGIDSSAIVALMSRITDDVNTFCVSFAEEKYSEARFARVVSNKFKTNHHEIILNPTDFLELIPNALDAMDHPSGDGLNTYVVSKATKGAGITMALSGLGGDELFAGYPIFPQSLKLDKFKALNMLPRKVRIAAGILLERLKPGISSAKISSILSAEKVNAISAYPLYRQVFLDNQILDLLDDQCLAVNRVQGILEEPLHIDGRNVLPLLSQISIAEIETYMQHVLLRDTDQMSMAHALEVRVPFLDHELIELVLGLSDCVKYPHTPKELLVDALGDLLPPEIVHRPKMGFTLPFEKWMKHELREYCDQSLKQLLERPYFRAETVQRYWSDFLAGRPSISWSRLWMLVVLGHWLDMNEVV